jgi:DNA-binding GntR family transcriptional regulator
MASRASTKRQKTAPLSASQRVELYIKSAIYSGALKPRERVIEEEIAKQLHCSRGPVREGLLRLERDGLIVTIPRRGSFIRDISAESIDVVFRIRGKLEGLCVRYMRESLTEKDRAALSKCLDKMRAAAAKGDNEQFLQADMHLHQTIWQLSRRQQLFLTLNTVMNPSIFMVARAYSSQTPIFDRCKDHENYVQMILTAPVNRVERQVEEYFQRLHDSLFNRNPFLVSLSERPWMGSDLKAEHAAD